MIKLWNDEMRRPCDSTPAMAGYGVIPLCKILCCLRELNSNI